MTNLRTTAHRMLVLRFTGVRCAIAAAELAAIDQDGDAARIPVDGPVRDLEDYLPGCGVATRPPLRLIVQVGGRRRGFRACAELELVETSALYRMPRVMRDLGLAPWLRGIAVLDERRPDRDQDDDHDPDDDHDHPTLWINLTELAMASAQEP